jgi:myo-inositol-1(or 4)-monophosphatase
VNFSAILDEAAMICRDAGQFQKAHFGTITAAEITDKGLNQLVSFVDIETEKMLVSKLGEIFPAAAFITEENTVLANKEAEYAWVIDPLDGTTNFLHGLPAFCISVALLKNGDPILGVVYAPIWDELFFAEKGKGAFLNGQSINVSKAAMLKESLLATGFPYYEFEYMQPYLNTLRILMQGSHGLRRMGSAAIDLAYTACGRFDGFFELGLHSWDVAAGVLLVSEAGGLLADFNGGNDYIFGKSIIAANPLIFAEMQRTLALNF